MDGIGGTVKNIFCKVLSGEVVIGSPEEFAQYAHQICQVDSLYLPTAEIPDEPEDVQYSSSIPDTLKTHQVVRSLSKHKIPYLNFYYMSTDPEPLYRQWYGPEGGHVENGQKENTCAFCLKSYNAADFHFFDIANQTLCIAFLLNFWTLQRSFCISKLHIDASIYIRSDFLRYLLDGKGNLFLQISLQPFDR